MTKRQYAFKLPYIMDAIHNYYGVGMLEQEGVFQHLPTDLQKKMNEAKENMQSVKVTEAELNEIGDDAWGRIAMHLGLKWSPAVA